MYTQEDMTEVKRRLTKRWWITAVPAVLLVAAAVAVFVAGQLARSETLWMLTAALTVAGGVYFLFFYGVYTRPMLLYARHVDYMLNGRKRETTGVLKAFASEVSDKEGIDCHAMLINVGERDEEEDDRLFYYDAHKPKPEMPLGTRVTVVSNDRMVAEMRVA